MSFICHIFFLWGKKEECGKHKSEEEMNTYVYKEQLAFTVNKILIKRLVSDNTEQIYLTDDIQYNSVVEIG